MKLEFENLRRAKPVWFCALLFLLLAALDLFSKAFIFNSFLNNHSPKYFGLQLFRNYNFAFSLPVPGFIMYAAYGIILFIILNIFFRDFYKLNSIYRVAWVLILSGAVLNIGERIILGYVRDFIYIFSGIFNLADFYILAGVMLLFFIPERPAP